MSDPAFIVIVDKDKKRAGASMWFGTNRMDDAMPMILQQGLRDGRRYWTDSSILSAFVGQALMRENQFCGLEADDMSIDAVARDWSDRVLAVDVRGQKVWAEGESWTLVAYSSLPPDKVFDLWKSGEAACRQYGAWKRKIGRCLPRDAPRETSHSG